MVNLGKLAKGLVSAASDAYKIYEEQQQQQKTGGSDTDGTTPELDDGSNIPLSTCNGNKKSLFIGINYVGSKSELRGCINDVKNIKEFVVTNFHFPTDDDHMKTLTDDNPDAMPSRANILEAFQWLVDGAKSGDSLFLHYSGHGASQQDDDGDDKDGKDETLVPVDYESAGLIDDDEIHSTLVAKVPEGVRLTCIMDCCHSGSILDLPYTYGVDANNNIVETDNRKAVLEAAMKAGMSFMKGDKEAALQSGIQALKLHFLAPPTTSGKSGTDNNGTTTNEQQIELRSTIADVIQFSGCRDDQTSADACIEGASTGAMSWSFIESFEKFGLNQTYLELLGNIRTLLQGKYSQVPQMSTGHKMDMQAKFNM